MTSSLPRIRIGPPAGSVQAVEHPPADLFRHGQGLLPVAVGAEEGHEQVLLGVDVEALVAEAALEEGAVLPDLVPLVGGVPGPGAGALLRRHQLGATFLLDPPQAVCAHEGLRRDCLEARREQQAEARQVPQGAHDAAMHGRDAARVDGNQRVRLGAHAAPKLVGQDVREGAPCDPLDEPCQDHGVHAGVLLRLAWLVGPRQRGEKLVGGLAVDRRRQGPNLRKPAQACFELVGLDGRVGVGAIDLLRGVDAGGHVQDVDHLHTLPAAQSKLGKVVLNGQVGRDLSPILEDCHQRGNDHLANREEEMPVVRPHAGILLVDKLALVKDGNTVNSGEIYVGVKGQRFGLAHGHGKGGDF
mmetsp:Transcript_96106/g.310313  ORF Transcript_96106/g.310313 Transcript_96106/m.310313 type:complete len:357 (+) Transcript_96106:194-1264(+)